MTTKRDSRGTQIDRAANLYRMVNLSGVLRPWLEDQCRRNGITGYSRMNKEALKDAIIQNLFYSEAQATVTINYDGLESVECSKATFDAVSAKTGDTTPSHDELIRIMAELLDERSTFQTPTTIPQQTVVDKLRDAKRRYNWCGSADSCVRDMGIDVGRGPAYYEGLTVEMDTVRRIAQDYGNRSGFTNEVNTLLREMGITA